MAIQYYQWPLMALWLLPGIVGPGVLGDVALGSLGSPPQTSKSPKYSSRSLLSRNRFGILSCRRAFGARSLRYLKLWNCKRQVRICCCCPRVPKCKSHTAPKSQNPKVPKAQSPEVQKSVTRKVPKSQNPEVKHPKSQSRNSNMGRRTKTFKTDPKSLVARHRSVRFRLFGVFFPKALAKGSCSNWPGRCSTVFPDSGNEPCLYRAPHCRCHIHYLVSSGFKNTS